LFLKNCYANSLDAYAKLSLLTSFYRKFLRRKYKSKVLHVIIYFIWKNIFYLQLSSYFVTLKIVDFLSLYRCKIFPTPQQFSLSAQLPFALHCMCLSGLITAFIWQTDVIKVCVCWLRWKVVGWMFGWMGEKMKPSIEFQLQVQIGLEIACRRGWQYSICVFECVPNRCQFHL